MLLISYSNHIIFYLHDLKRKIIDSFEGYERKSLGCKKLHIAEILSNALSGATKKRILGSAK
jgi:hypothetical protein